MRKAAVVICNFVIFIFVFISAATPIAAEDGREISDDMWAFSGQSDPARLKDDTYTGPGYAMYKDRSSIKWRGYFVNGYADGMFISYEVNGRVTSVVGRKSGLMHGFVVSFHENGMISSVIGIFEGKNTGLVQKYSSDGRANSE